MGKATHPENDITIEIAGADKYTPVLASVGLIPSLAINLTPSASGCNTPYIPTTFGPLRLCIAARTFRSISVKYATDTSIDININNIDR